MPDTPEESPPSKEEVDKFFSNRSNVEKLMDDMDDIAAQQRAAALEKAAEARAEEERRRLSPHRVQPSGEVFNPETGAWEKMRVDD